MTSRAAVVLVFLSFLRVGFAADALTPMGAEAQGNDEGTIPRWTGEPVTSLEGGDLADPYPDESPLFIITAQNYRAFGERLSTGHRALFAKYPDYTLPIYRSHRDVLFPERVYAETLANEARAHLLGVDAIEGARVGIPFRRPTSGVELAWNHRLRYRGDTAQWNYRRAMVWGGGGTKQDQAIERTLYRYATLQPIDRLEPDAMHSYNLLQLSACEEQPGVHAAWHEPLNARTVARKLWATWADSGGRVFRYPPLSHDEIGFCSFRTRFFDQMDMFNGAFGRYTFKLMGKRELYVPYNAFRLNQRRLRVADLLASGHIRQDHSRYELHRVWLVDATLRPGQTHSISRRTFYIDEDSWSILLVDCYDRHGKLWRVQEGHLIPLRSVQGVDYAPLLTYDLADGRYFADRLTSESALPRFNISMMPDEFVSTSLRFQ